MKENNIQKKYFASQDPDENVILIIRKHKLVLWLPFISATVFGVLLFSFYGLFEYTDLINLNSLARAIIVCVISIMFLFTILYAFTSWLIKYLDILILTSKHLVIVRQNGIFSRDVSTLDLATIQDVATSQHGVIQTMFNFGKVIVQTAGEMPNFVYNNVGNPNDIQDAIMDAKELYIKKDTNISSSIVKEVKEVAEGN